MPGISNRRYARSLEPLPQELSTRSASKSAVSEHFVYGTERKLAGVDESGLERVGFGSIHDRRGALRRASGAGGGGVDEPEEKHVLGLREGATGMPGGILYQLRSQ